MISDTQKPMQEFLNRNNLVVRICGGAVTFCDGDCENCSDEDYEDEDYEID